MPLNQWISDFLFQRGLQEPDGRPLFAYKTSSEEFESLRQLLQNLPAGQHTSTRYPQAWLLFAAEWWKREYPGGAWRWGPLCEAAGQRELSHEKTRKLVIDGRGLWRLQTAIKNEGKRFIGLVAVNGGLPMRLVESAQGGLSGLLRMVTEQALRYGLQDDQLRQAIEAQAALLPACYQQAPVYELLDNLVKAVLYIRKTYVLQDSQDPIAKLQEECPQWEDLFPIALDSQAAASLIKGLVRGIVSITPQSRRPPFQIQRGLRFSSDGSMPVYELSFAMQAQARRDQVAEALGMAVDALPPHFQLLLRIGEREHLVGEALLRDEEYQLIARPLPAFHSLHDAAQLIVSRWGATLHIANLPGGEALSPDEPLIFESAYPYARLLAQGDALVKGESALAAMPVKTIVFAEEGEARELYDCLADGQMLMELPAGITRLTYRQQPFIVTISANTTQPPEAYWQGSSLEALSVPGLLFRGLPRLLVEQGTGFSNYAPAHELFVRTQGKELPLAQTRAPGLCRLIWRKDGQRLLSTRVVLLPDEASITYSPSASTFEGTIHLHRWPDVPVRCESEQISLQRRHDGTSLILRLKSTGSRPATTVPLCLQWPDGEQRLTLPFPGYGVTLLRNDMPLKLNQALTIEELIGCRAVLMSAQGAENWQIRLTSGGTDSRSTLTQEIRYTGIREIRLFELIPAIQKMLSCHPGLDHAVLLELTHAHQTHARLQIGLYSTRIRLHSQREMASLSDGSRDLLLEQPQAEGLLLGLPLAEPDHEPVSLPLHFSEQVFTGSWLVSLPADAVGPWLLYTPDNSPLHSRPTVVPPTTSAPSKPLSPLREALCEADGEERLRLLRAALRSMAADPQADDWQTLELLLDRLHHLPLASLDICQALIREPQALTMATLLLDNFSSRLAERLPCELPFEWLLIAPEHWFDTFATLRQQLAADNPHLMSVIRNDIQSKSQFLSRWQPALRFIFDQGLHRSFDLQSPDVGFFLKNPAMLTASWQSHLFDGENSAMQQMFRRNPAETHRYPGSGNTDIGAFLKTPHGQVLLRHCKLPTNDFKLAVVALPFMAAFDTYAGDEQQWQADPSRLFSLRSARQFDTVWFDLAYQLGLAMAQAASMQK
ncbi:MULTISPECIES: STY4851/ECs_5259 family protein [Stutzerimonas]|uniref:STY4851/ECs_5259 family protein n=1 Tax=Stutzerimonas TaxID=2901164 RepID=UPI001F4FB733|nr:MULTISPECIES: STY4851/ECs_5259 family protein [Stutzerimonas]MCQ4256211.1 STY4851/ECs_5259 family protein [Stutzerimonas stutzeri]